MDRYYANNGFQKPAYVEKYTSGFRKRQQLNLPLRKRQSWHVLQFVSCSLASPSEEGVSSQNFQHFRYKKNSQKLVA